MERILILDGYIDEPALFGVSPFISPYPRYIAGALKSAGLNSTYITVDHWRKNRYNFNNIDVLIVIAGAIVPGKYLRSSPASLKEIATIASQFNGTRILAGPASLFNYNGMDSTILKDYFDYFTKGDPDAWIYDFFTGTNPSRRLRTADEWKSFSVNGVYIVTMHQDFPVPLIAEIELYKGCIRYRTGGCSFCTEILYGKIRNRSENEILDEISALYNYGIRYFRLGGATCIFTYMADEVDSKAGIFKPVPTALEKLLKGIWKVAPELKCLHTDNANPHVIAQYSDESTKIIKMLVRYTTAGNVLSFGLESADPEVYKANNLNATDDEVLFAIDLVNRYGRNKGVNGMPQLLPGINFIIGLDGETSKTYDYNKDFLEKVLKSGNLVRRVNIRQVAPARREFETKINKKKFIEFKDYVRGYFDKTMLSKMLPLSSEIKDIFIEFHLKDESYGRQIGTYPLLIKFPYKIKSNAFVDGKIVSYGSRSVGAIDTFFNINYAPLSAIKKIPGIKPIDATALVMKRPFNSYEEVSKIIKDSRALGNIQTLTKVSRDSYWVNNIFYDNLKISD